MKILLAILSCERDVFLEHAQLMTFLRGAKIDYRFFRGRCGASLRDDVIHLDCPDDFPSLPFKTQAMCSWALGQGYDYIFKCDTDTYVRPERLLASNFSRYDYSGYFSYEPGPGAYASGGSGYWLSARAAHIVTQAKFIIDPQKDSVEPSTRGEDLQVGWALRDANISCAKDVRYRLRDPGPRFNNPYITLHDVVSPLKSAERMSQVHREWLKSCGVSSLS